MIKVACVTKNPDLHVLGYLITLTFVKNTMLTKVSAKNIACLLIIFQDFNKTHICIGVTLLYRARVV